MVPLAIIALVLFAGSACGGSSDRIVGGWPTSVEKWPSIVQVDSLGVFSGVWSHSCGANILTNYHILSAAHCFAGIFYQPQNRRIRAGTSLRNTGGVIVYVARELNHPSYGSVGYDGDITVVRLLSALVNTPVVQQGYYPIQGYSVADNTPVIHAGWGTIYSGGPASPELLETQIYTINNKLCAERYATLNRPMLVVTENMICAGLLDIGGRDACQGDSGGPLYYNDGTRDVIVGVVSWGEGCANATFPGVSTRVASYTNWILANVV